MNENLEKSLSSINRITGYYWVKPKTGKWVVGSWSSVNQSWVIIGKNGACRDSYFQEINEIRINRVGTLLSVCDSFNQCLNQSKNNNNTKK